MPLGETLCTLGGCCFFMDKIHYAKPPITICEQVALLKSRGLIIDDEMRATHWLETTSYYRLSGYMYPFLADKERHIYKRGAKFDDVIGLYLFDRELRLLVFGAIEKIEVAVRAQIAYQYSNDLNNPFWLLDNGNFRSPQEHNKLVCKITDDVRRSKAVFIEHFYDK